MCWLVGVASEDVNGALDIVCTVGQIPNDRANMPGSGTVVSVACYKPVSYTHQTLPTIGG